MKVTITNAELDAIYQYFNTLSQKEFKPSFAFKVAKIVRVLNDHYEDFMTKRKELFDKYVKKDGDDNPIQAVDDDGKKVEGSYELTDSTAFGEELQELVTSEFEVDVPVKLTPYDFEEAGVSLNLQRSLDIEKLIQVDEK